MPVADASPTADVAIAASGIVELVWALGALTFVTKADRLGVPGAAAANPELTAEVRTFWRDVMNPHSDGLDLLVLGARAGLIPDPTVGRPLIARLMAEAATPPAEDIALRSEPVEDRRITRARLERLAADAELRQRYGDLLGRVWDAVGERAWRERGAAEVDRTAQLWRSRIDEAGSLFAALPPTHVMRRPEHARVVADALARGARLVLAPSFMGGSMNAGFELDGILLSTIGVDPERDLAERRREAEAIASRLKMLADPTRLMILSQLCIAPLSVTEIADLLGLAQPTVSVHLQKLRDGGFIQHRREHGRIVHSASQAELERTLDDLRGSLWSLCRAPEPTDADAP